MDELALYCTRSGDAVEFIAAYVRYASRIGLPHVVAYVGGSPDRRRWRAERILIERAPDESVALVTEMGEWSAGEAFVRPREELEYHPAARRPADLVDPEADDRIYDLVNHWAYWDEGVLRLQVENVGSAFAAGDVARVGPVDDATIAELRSIWLTSWPEPS